MSDPNLTLQLLMQLDEAIQRIKWRFIPPANQLRATTGNPLKWVKSDSKRSFSPLSVDFCY